MVEQVWDVGDLIHTGVMVKRYEVPLENGALVCVTRHIHTWTVVLQLCTAENVITSIVTEIRTI